MLLLCLTHWYSDSFKVQSSLFLKLMVAKIGNFCLFSQSWVRLLNPKRVTIVGVCYHTPRSLFFFTLLPIIFHFLNLTSPFTAFSFPFLEGGGSACLLFLSPWILIWAGGSIKDVEGSCIAIIIKLKYSTF